MNARTVRPLRADEEQWVADILEAHWGSRYMVSRGRLWDVAAMPGFVALHAGEPAGVVTYRIDGDACEVTVLLSLRERVGAGTALLDAVHEAAREAGCRRVWLITANDNMHALRFYQKRGYRLAALYPGALDESRRLRPQIPLLGMNGIPLRDEIELEFLLL